MLRAAGVITPEDSETLSSGSSSCPRIRNELHFRAGQPQDVLTRDEQVRVAKWMGFESLGPLLHVERFMQQYHRQTTGAPRHGHAFAHGAEDPGYVRQIMNGSRPAGWTSITALPATISIDPDISAETMGKAGDAAAPLRPRPHPLGRGRPRNPGAGPQGRAGRCTLTPESKSEESLSCRSCPVPTGPGACGCGAETSTGSGCWAGSFRRSSMTALYGWPVHRFFPNN
jgi:hypothetical protein